MLSKLIWILLAVFIVIGILIFGTMGVSVTPVKIEKEISTQKLPQ